MNASSFDPSIFKAYDIRGRVPEELDEATARLIGGAVAHLIRPKVVIVGRDMRLTGESLASALTQGLCESGVDVVDIGMVGTEEVYFATFSLEADGGVMVTASHNPADYNGMKVVREKAIPVSGDTGLMAMRDWVGEAAVGRGPLAGSCVSSVPGRVSRCDISEAYVEHVLSYADLGKLKPLRIVVNGGNGMAGPVVERIASRLPFDVIVLQGEPDGTFPNGVPNPLLPERRRATSEAVRDHEADLGVAFDGDFDRCFFFDETGAFVEGYYLVGLLAQQALLSSPGGAIVHDPRLVWNTIELVVEAGGRPVMNKSGHAFIKERMRREDAVYGGEMSAHHYFRRFSYCDSGMIPWLMVAELMCTSGRSLSSLVGERLARYPVSGEVNLELGQPEAALAALRRDYGREASSVDDTDGVSLDFGSWRVNVRASNTEPVVRVNLESRGDRALLDAKTQKVLDFLRTAGA